LVGVATAECARGKHRQCHYKYYDPHLVVPPLNEWADPRWIPGGATPISPFKCGDTSPSSLSTARSTSKTVSAARFRPELCFAYTKAAAAYAKSHGQKVADLGEEEES
jgi:hypothetical protein